MKNVWIVVAVTLLSACASKQIMEEPQTITPQQSENKSTEMPAAKTPPTAQTSDLSRKSITVNPLKDPGNILSKRNIYFDFDKYEIKPEYRALVEAHAKYLIAYPQIKITLQGNADDRGSREYNLALGQKRAVAVKQMMNVLGVPDRQIETISFGEEKPVALGHDDLSWSENRRADIVYPGD